MKKCPKCNANMTGLLEGCIMCGWDGPTRSAKPSRAVNTDKRQRKRDSPSWWNIKETTE